MTEETLAVTGAAPGAPHPDFRSLERLVGTWRVSGPDIEGQVRYTWMEGGHFLLQHVDFVHGGRRIKGMEVIGHLRPFGEAPNRDIVSRFYDTEGNTLDYVYELEGDTLTIWGEARGSPAYYRGSFSVDGASNTGAWVYPGGGGYEATMTRIL